VLDFWKAESTAPTPQSADPVAHESTRLFCAAVTGAQTTLDPQQMKEWTPNSRYGGRAFGMPTILVGGPETSGRRNGANVVPGSAAQALTGRVRVVAQNALGFASPGDRARYALDVRVAGQYHVFIYGQDLDACMPLSLKLGDTVLSPVRRAADAIRFGTVSLVQGPRELELATAAAGPEARAAAIRQIVLQAVTRPPLEHGQP
jgi:hypothetical protein